MKRILLIEDDTALREELAVLLKNAGYETRSVTDFRNVIQQIKESISDLILLDVNLPGTNGETLLRELRCDSDTPVIMLTSGTDEIDEVLSMSYGADDYITKPYNPTILLLRITAVLRRANKTNADACYHYRDLDFSPVSGSIKRGESGQILTKNEAILFQLLLSRQGEIISRDELITVLWDNDEFVNDNTLSVNMSRLRTKLGTLGYPDAIETRKKQGYILI